MIEKPREIWRLMDWYTLPEAAYLAINIDPSETQLTDEQRKNVEISIAALGRAAAADSESAKIQLHTVLDSNWGYYPEENQTKLHADWVRDFLSSKGITTGFFFPEADKETDAFRDPNHEHYSAELHLAVMAWEALESERIFPKGPKQAISDWLDEHSKDWPAEKRPGPKATERIKTMVNWKKEGGANKTP